MHKTKKVLWHWCKIFKKIINSFAIAENEDNLFQSIKTFKLWPYIVYIIGSIFGLDLDQRTLMKGPVWLIYIIRLG